MLKKSLVLTSLTLLLAVPATQISGLSASASPSKRLRMAPKVLRGYWQNDYDHGSFIEHIAKHKVTYISKGYEPDIFTPKWSTGKSPHTFKYSDGSGLDQQYFYHVSHSKFHIKDPGAPYDMTGRHRISHAKFLQIYNSWARYYRLNTPTKPVSTKTTQKLKAAPKILQGYWRDGDEVVHVTKHKVISVANYPHKGNRPVVIKAEWSTGEEPHTYYYTEVYDGIRGNYPIFVYKISRNSYRGTRVLHNQFTSTSHRISHAQYNRLCKAWIK